MRPIGMLLVLAILAAACTSAPPTAIAPTPSASSPASVASPATMPSGRPSLGAAGRSPDATASPPSTEDRVHELSVDGRARRYRLMVPASAASQAPAVVALHGAGSSPRAIAEGAHLDDTAATDGFVVAYPEAIGLAATWNAGFCCGPARAAGIDDLGFLDQVIEELRTDPRVDSDRIYLAGVSNGAILAYRYACEHADRVAGVASVAGTMQLADCRPSSALPVLEVHGTADPLLPFDGGTLTPFAGATAPIPSTRQLVEHWADTDGCDPAPDVRTRSPVVTTTWSNCDDDATVRLVAVEGAGHARFAEGFGPGAGTVDVADMAAAFFGLDAG